MRRPLSPVLLAAALLSAGVAAHAAEPCDWRDPGAQRYTGTTDAAVERYRDIPADVRAALKERLRNHRYDDIATITRDGIAGRARYATELRDMHFGSGRVCSTVSRSAWPAAHAERGLVYCESGHCLLVPTVCGNVSRVTRLGAAAPTAGAGGPGGPGTGSDAGPPAQPAIAAPGGPASGLPGLPGTDLADLLPGGGGSDAPTGGTGGTGWPASGTTFAGGGSGGGGSGGGFGGDGSDAGRMPFSAPPAPVQPSPWLNADPITTPVPEVGSRALWLAGLGMLAVLLRRRSAR